MENKKENQILDKPKPEVLPFTKLKDLPDISPEQLQEILLPDLSNDEFELEGVRYRIRALTWKWDQIFRRSAMPIIAQEWKPFERALFVLSNEKLLQSSEALQLTESIADSEIEGDRYLTNSVVSILLSQDKQMLEAGAKGVEVPLAEQLEIERKYRSVVENLTEIPGGGSVRKYLRDIVRRQMDKQKMVQTLGESLMARLAETSELTGTKNQFDSLKQAFTQRVRNFTAKVGSIAETPDSLSLPSTDNGSATLPTAKPTKKAKEKEKPRDAGTGERELTETQAVTQ